VFIDQNKDGVAEGRRLGVEPICEVLQVAPSSYYAARDRPLSARARRDAELTPRLTQIWKDNYQVYGSRKLWKTARRAEIEIGRDQSARLMRQAGIQGVLRSKRVRTTRRDQNAGRHPDLVKREFRASNPNELWVTDLTFVATWAGVAYVCFIVDAFSRMIVGGVWRGTCAPRWSSTRLRWPAGTAGCTTRICAVIAMPGRSSRPFATASGSRRSARPPRSGRSVTARTMPWPKPSTATTKPS